MRRLFITSILLVLVLCVFAVPAFASGWDNTNIDVIDYLDYADSEHIEVDGDSKYVVLRLPCYNESLFVYGDGRYFTDGWDDVVDIPGDAESNLTFYNYPTIKYLYDTNRFGEGTVFDVSMLPVGAQIQFTWEITFNGYSGSVETLSDKFDYYSYYFAEPGSENYSYRTGRTDLFGLPSHIVGSLNKVVATCLYEKGSSVVGTATDYIAPAIRIQDIYFSNLPTSITCRTSAVEVIFPIDDSLIQIAQNEKTQKLIKEIDRQLNEQGMTMQSVLNEQKVTNEKLDGVHDAINDTNDKLDDIMGYKPDVDTPEGGEVVGELEDVENNLMNEVNNGFAQAENLQTSVLEYLLSYLSAFAVVSYIFDLFAWIPFIKVLLSVSLALGIVSALLNIGLSVSSGASKSKSDGKHGAKVKK